MQTLFYKLKGIEGRYDDDVLSCSDAVNPAVKPIAEADDRIQAIINQHKAKVTHDQTPPQLTSAASASNVTVPQPTHWRHGSLVRTSVFCWRTFPDLCLICG